MATKWIDELAVKEEAQARWREDSALRVEFGSFACYLAFAKASAAGLVRIVGTKPVQDRVHATQQNAQRPAKREDRQELKQWAEQTVRRIRGEHGAPLTDVKPHKVQMLEGPRIFSDAALLQIIASEQDAKQYWDISEALREEFPTPANLWAYVKMKRKGRIKILSQPEGPRSTGTKPQTSLTSIGPGPSSGGKMFNAVTYGEDA